MSELDRGPREDGNPGSDQSDELEAEEVLEGLPDATKQRVIRMLMRAEEYSSPHPHPEHLERYEALYPGAAEIVFGQFKAQGDHRRKMESMYMRGSERRANIGQWLAFVMVSGVLASGIVLALNGQAATGAAIAVAGLGGGVMLVIAGKQSARKTAVKGSPTQRRSTDVGAHSDEQS